MLKFLNQNFVNFYFPNIQKLSSYDEQMRRYSFLKIQLRKRHTHYSGVEHRAQKITLLPDGEKKPGER